MAKTITPFESPSKFAERRTHPRAKAEFDITIGTDSRSSVRVRDISKSGVAFVSAIPIPEMTLVRLELVLPGAKGNLIKADGAVVRSEKRSGGDYDIGVFFMAITDTAREEIAGFVTSRIKSEQSA